jgi:hypothetical protein
LTALTLSTNPQIAMVAFFALIAIDRISNMVKVHRSLGHLTKT